MINARKARERLEELVVCVLDRKHNGFHHAGVNTRANKSPEVKRAFLRSANPILEETTLKGRGTSGQENLGTWNPLGWVYLNGETAGRGRGLDQAC